VSWHQKCSQFTLISYYPINYCHTNTPFLAFHVLRSIASPGFNSRSSMSLSTTSFQVFLSSSLFDTLSLKSCAFSPSSFLKVCPYQLNLFCCTIVAMTSIPNLCLNATHEPCINWYMNQACICHKSCCWMALIKLLLTNNHQK